MSEPKIFGYLDLTKSQMVYVLDPCYMKDIGTPYDGEFILNLSHWGAGKYPVAVMWEDGRISKLILARSEECLMSKWNSVWVTVHDGLGVDSGQMSFMVTSVFKDIWTDEWGEDLPEDQWSDYYRICSLTLDCGYGMSHDNQIAASSSGYGDGVYTLLSDDKEEVYVVDFFGSHYDDYGDEEEYTEEQYEEGLDYAQFA